jgi:hypothetical protein
LKADFENLCAKVKITAESNAPICNVLSGRTHPLHHSNGPAAPHGLPALILASSQFLVRIDNENKYTMAAACGSLAREWLESGGLLPPARAQPQNLFTMDAA